MANNIHDTYLENEVLGADPVKLIRSLYRGAIEAIGAARKHLRAGAIRERSSQIGKAWEIVHELLRSLDHVRGGEISRSLAELYAYMAGRLVEANAKQIEEPLEEVERLLTTLLEAWSALPAPAPAAEAYEPVSCTY